MGKKKEDGEPNADETASELDAPEGDEAEGDTGDADEPSTSEIALPSRITMTRPHGFIEDETEIHRHWHQGQVVTDPAEIALLVERGADFEVTE